MTLLRQPVARSLGEGGGFGGQALLMVAVGDLSAEAPKERR